MSSATAGDMGRRRIWPWLLGGLGLLLLLGLAAGLAALLDAGIGLNDSVHVVLNGEDWQPDATSAGWTVLVVLLAGGAAVLMAVLAALIVVPLGLALALLAMALGVAVAVAAVLAVALALASPLWLPLLLLWLLLRRKPAAPAHAARMEP